MAKAVTWPGYEGEPRTFADFPGVYGPGVELPLSDLGLSEEEATARLPKDLAIVDLEDKPADSQPDAEPEKQPARKTKGGES